MNATDELSSDSDWLKFFCRHLLALCITFELDNEQCRKGTPRFAAYAGTLIRIRDTYCFLTAGHILREVERALRSEIVEIKNVVLADTFGNGQFDEHPIPFDLRGARLFYIDDDAEGLDFGVILLEPQYLRLLAANGIVAIEEVNWAHQSNLSFDGYAMLGLPAEFTSDFVSSSGVGVVSPTMFGIARLETPPHGSVTTRHTRFVGHVDAEALGLKGIEGMSGGPIFGFKLDEQHPRYWVVALQSCWNRAHGVVYGCPVPILASFLTKWADAA